MDYCREFVKVINEELMPKFKTKIEELLPKIPPKGNGPQILAMLKNNGVTDEEIKWTKMGNLLAQPKVTKDEIIAHLKKHGMPFLARDYSSEKGSRYQNYALKGGKNYGEKILKFEGDHKPFKLEWEVIQEPEYSDAKEQINGYVPGSDRSGKYNPPDRPIAEILIRPTESGLEITCRVKDENYYGNGSSDGGSSRWINLYNDSVSEEHKAITINTLKNLAEEKLGEFEERDNVRPEDYKSNHWEGNNPLFHIRHQDFTDADGKNLFLIEEIQSDWHQQGRKKGYGDGKRKVQILYDNNPLHVDLDSGNEFSSQEEAEKYVKDSVPKSYHDKITYRSYNPGGIPDAPMKKSWEEMGFKWALHMAVEANAERIGWVTGDISAERYDLSKSISTIELFDEKAKHPHAWEKQRKSPSTPILANGGKQYKLRAYDAVGVVVFDKYVEEDDLPDIIGKDLADRLIKQTPIDHYRIIKGDDMKIGGEGMKAAYDQRIVSIANKIAKKTGSKVGKVKLPSATGKDFDDDAETMYEITQDSLDELRNYLLYVGNFGWSLFGEIYPPQEDPNSKEEEERKEKKEKYNSDEAYWKECFFDIGVGLPKKVEDLTNELMSNFRKRLLKASDIESEYGDDSETIVRLRNIKNILGWKCTTNDVPDNFGDYISWKNKRSEVMGEMVWYMDITPGVKSFVEGGMRATFESIKEPWWVITESKKPKTSKPWWVV